MNFSSYFILDMIRCLVDSLPRHYRNLNDLIHVAILLEGDSYELVTRYLACCYSVGRPHIFSLLNIEMQKPTKKASINERKWKKPFTLQWDSIVVLLNRQRNFQFKQMNQLCKEVGP